MRPPQSWTQSVLRGFSGFSRHSYVYNGRYGDFLSDYHRIVCTRFKECQYFPFQSTHRARERDWVNFMHRAQMAAM